MNGVGWRVCAVHSSSLINGDGSPVLRVFTKSPVEISFHRTLETFSARIIVPLPAFLSSGEQYGNVGNAIIRKKKKKKVCNSRCRIVVEVR